MQFNRIRDLLRGNGSKHFIPMPRPVFDEVPATALEEKQQLLAHHVRLVARGMTNGLFVFGAKGGLGKTKVILQTLREEGVRALLLNGHITPLSLYTNLYHNHEKLIFLDDADSLYRNLPALGILRSALWGDRNERLVTYNSSQIDLPSSFHFTGRIIFTANVLPTKNQAFNAVLSRIDVFELDASNEEVIELMQHLAKQGFDGLSPEECSEVVEFIAQHGSTRELSLRLLEPSYKKVIYAQQVGIEWQDLVKSQLDQIGADTTDHQGSKEDDLDCLRQAVRDHQSVKDQIESWCKLTVSDATVASCVSW